MQLDIHVPYMELERVLYMQLEHVPYLQIEHVPYLQLEDTRLGYGIVTCIQNIYKIYV